MVPGKQRISRRDFAVLYKKGKLLRFPLASFRISSDSKQKNTHFSVVIPGKWQKQKAIRNKLKRRAVEILGQVSRELKSDISFICFLKKESAELSFSELKSMLQHCFKETNKKN